LQDVDNKAQALQTCSIDNQHRNSAPAPAEMPTISTLVVLKPRFRLS